MSDVLNTMNLAAVEEAIDEAMCTDALLSAASFLRLMNVNDPCGLMGRLWENNDSGAPVVVTASILQWLGYDGAVELQTNQFRRMLDEASIPYSYETVSGAAANDRPEVAGDIEENREGCSENRTPPEGVVLTGSYFKLACLSARTSSDRATARFFAELEDACRAYREYTKRWEARTYEERDQQRQHDHEMELFAVSARHDEQIRQLSRQAEQDASDAENELYAKAKRYVPRPATAEREEYLVMVKMAPKYVRADSDPAYLRDCTWLFVRTQRRNLNYRLKLVRSFGNTTNNLACIHYAIKSPNARALFAAFKLLAGDGRIIVLSRYGGKWVESDENVIELLLRANAQKFADVYDDDDDDDDDGLGEWDRRVDENQLLASTAN